jgi:CxxC-x17-CxxC domain-containing protein
MNLTDKHLTCVECGSAFVFTIGEQQFFVEHSFDTEPKRCRLCRAARRQSAGPARRSDTRQWFSAICDDCGQETLVPFHPQVDRPVYCLECYRARQVTSRTEH